MKAATAIKTVIKVVVISIIVVVVVAACLALFGPKPETLRIVAKQTSFTEATHDFLGDVTEPATTTVLDGLSGKTYVFQGKVLFDSLGLYEIECYRIHDPSSTTPTYRITRTIWKFNPV